MQHLRQLLWQRRLRCRDGLKVLLGEAPNGLTAFEGDDLLERGLGQEEGGGRT